MRFIVADVDALKARQVASFCQHPPKNMTLADVDKARGILLGLASKNIADCDAGAGSDPPNREAVRQT